jgi:hypothetical protein
MMIIVMPVLRISVWVGIICSRSQLLSLLVNLFNRWRWTRHLLMSVSTIRPIWTETKFVHITFFHLLVCVLVNTILLSALTEPEKEPTDRHPALVILMQKPTSITLHA